MAFHFGIPPRKSYEIVTPSPEKERSESAVGDKTGKKGACLLWQGSLLWLKI